MQDTNLKVTKTVRCLFLQVHSVSESFSFCAPQSWNELQNTNMNYVNCTLWVYIAYVSCVLYNFRLSYNVNISVGPLVPIEQVQLNVKVFKCFFTIVILL